jgi:predicted XRE-type DNA-binding protein
MSQKPVATFFLTLDLPHRGIATLDASREEMARADELKKQLMIEITDWIKHNGLKQVDAAKVLHVLAPACPMSLIRKQKNSPSIHWSVWQH